MTFKHLFSAACVSCLVLSSCVDNDHFSVSGKIGGADGKTVYLVREGADFVEVCDSAKLSEAGAYKLKGLRPVAPEFYSLRLDSASVWIAVDSTEKITLDAANNFTECTVSGSENCEQMLLWQKAIRQMNDTLNKVVAEKNISRDSVNHLMLNLVSSYKDTAKSYIRKHVGSPVAYYLLFKKVSLGVEPFVPLDNVDYNSFAVVANWWNKHYPNAPRTEFIKNVVNEARRIKNAERVQQLSEKSSTGFIDLTYPDHKNRMMSLSELKGKNVLLQFCYLALISEEVDKALRLIHERYKAKGFEIYMVTFDKNRAVWREKAAKYPWIIVLDQNQSSALTYNFREVPTNYFIDKSGNIVGRDISIDELIAYLETHN